MLRSTVPAIVPTATLALALTTAAPALPQDCTPRPGRADNCVRVLACIGDDGTWFDGHAYGWDNGTVGGHTNTGLSCAGQWSTRFGFGISRLTCSDGTVITVSYMNQDNATSTATGHGHDTQGRSVTAWSGNRVLDFLTPEGTLRPQLLCGTHQIPLS